MSLVVLAPEFRKYLLMLNLKCLIAWTKSHLSNKYIYIYGYKDLKVEVWQPAMYLKFYMFMHACSVVSSSLQPHGLWPTRLAHMSMEFSRQEYWSRLPFAIPRDYTFSYINNEYSLSMKIECTEMCISWTHQLSWKKSCSYYNNILVLVHIYLIYLIMCNPYRSQMHSFLYLLYLLA